MFGFRSILGKLNAVVSRVLTSRRSTSTPQHPPPIIPAPSEGCNPKSKQVRKPSNPTTEKSTEKTRRRKTKTDRLSAFNSLREALLSAYSNLLYSPRRISRVVSSLGSLSRAFFSVKSKDGFSVKETVDKLERDLNSATSTLQVESAISASGLSTARFFLVFDQSFPPDASSSGQFKSVRAALDRVIRVRNEIVLDNYGLVENVISRYFDTYPFDVKENLRQEAAIALSNAVLSYSQSSGVKFSTFASIAIRNNLNREIARFNSIVSIPVNANTLIGKLSKLRSELEISLGRQPTDEEIERECGNLNLTGIYKNACATLNAMSAAQHVSSLDAPLSPDSSSGHDSDDASHVDFLEDPNSIDPAASTEELNVRQFVSALVSNSKLSKRDLLILDASFGLTTREPKSLAQIGKSIHRTRERVRQLQAKAIAKIKRFVERNPEFYHAYSQFVSNDSRSSTISLSNKA